MDNDNSKSPEDLTRIEALILKMLIDHDGEMHALEMVDISNARLKQGTVYVTLERMERKGYIDSRKESRRPGVRGLPRSYYTPTGLGSRVLLQWEYGSSASRGGLT